jgi:hypothetical protein
VITGNYELGLIHPEDKFTIEICNMVAVLYFCWHEMLLRGGGVPKFHMSMEQRVEITDIALHNFLSLSYFSYKPEKFRDKIRSKTVLGENNGPDQGWVNWKIRWARSCEQMTQKSASANRTWANNDQKQAGLSRATLEISL